MQFRTPIRGKQAIEWPVLGFARRAGFLHPDAVSSEEHLLHGLGFKRSQQRTMLLVIMC